ncbi:MAG: GIY-YIG nuclease family protein [Acidilobaceae archaeon]
MLIANVKGIYMLIFELSCTTSIAIGSLGVRHLDTGLYIYIGSGRGPGGIRSRVLRHLMKSKRLWWHIDYVSTHKCFKAKSLVYAETTLDLESELASRLIGYEYMRPYIEGFGSTDKESITHLFKCNCSLEECLKTCTEALESLELNPKALHLNTNI